MTLQIDFDICFSVVENSGLRADVFLSSLLNVSRSRVQKNIALENLSVNGIVIKKNSYNRFQKGMTIEFEIEPVEQICADPEKMDLNIVFENDLFIIINKPAGLVVHPGAGNHSGTLVNGVVHHLNLDSGTLNKSDPVRPGLVHRIDKNTSGLLVIAKTQASFEELLKKMSVHDIKREYACLVRGHLKENKGTIETFHGRDPSNRLRFSPNVKNGKRAVTHYEVTAEYRYCSMIKVTLETGRTHQIRMHMSHIGHPVMNDLLYGGSVKTDDPVFNKKLSICARQLLHAKTLGFNLSGQTYLFESGLPSDMEEIIEYLESISGGKK
jgi:23S rRNA pseudouridine1911/1915/1917 synthase